MTSKFATYAIIALRELGAAGGKPVPMSRLAEVISEASGEQASLVYVQQVMRGPLNAGIVSSVRGPCGGYVLSRGLDQVSVYDVMAAVSKARRKDRSRAKTVAQVLTDKIDQHIATALQKLKVVELESTEPSHKAADRR